jgi:hypothetical protein
MPAFSVVRKVQNKIRKEHYNRSLLAQCPLSRKEWLKNNKRRERLELWNIRLTKVLNVMFKIRLLYNRQAVRRLRRYAEHFGKKKKTP